MTELELLAPANICSRALPTQVELQNQCSHLVKLKSTNSSLQKDIDEFSKKLNNPCDKAREAKKNIGQV